MNGPDACGHHCESDCPRCGEDRPKKPARPRRKPAPRPRPGQPRYCSCEGWDHNHGCPNGM